MDLNDEALGILREKVDESITVKEYTAIQDAAGDPEKSLSLTIAVSRNQQSRLSKKLHEAFRNFVRPLSRFTSPLDTLSQAHLVGLLVWGPIKIILQVRITRTS